MSLSAVLPALSSRSDTASKASTLLVRLARLVVLA